MLLLTMNNATSLFSFFSGFGFLVDVNVHLIEGGSFEKLHLLK